MAQRFFSPSTGGFYSTAFHGEAIPGDAIPITHAQHGRMMDAQERGKTVAEVNGKVRAVDRIDDAGERAARNRLRRNRLLRESDWTQLPDSPLDPEARAAWASYRQKLRDLDCEAAPDARRWPVPPKGDA